MPALHLLGTGSAISDPHRTTAMLAVSDDASPRNTLLVDCGGDVLQRLQACGPLLGSVAGLIVTHAHMDHTSGFPLFMEKIWLDGRDRPIPVCGIDPALAQVQRLWEAYEPVHADWEGVPEIDWRKVQHKRDAQVWAEPPWTVIGSPVDHGDMPTIGLRLEHNPTGHVIAYSCDTAPTSSVVHLAQNADILVHEANGAGDNHSTATGAAEVAAEADVDRLLLVHLPAGDKTDALREARSIFPHTDLGEELSTYPFAP
ncbi:MAG: MBL fold metallo-hydrolase [Salinibacter sp.]